STRSARCTSASRARSSCPHASGSTSGAPISTWETRPPGPPISPAHIAFEPTRGKTMSDFLLELSKNKNARKLVQGLGLPLPMPQALERDEQPWEERPLFDRQIAVGVGPRAELQ